MFSILSFNLRFGLANDGSNDWIYRKNVFPYLFKTYASDFMGFQEVNDFQADFLREILTDYEVIGERKPVPPFWQNNLIFYKKDWKCIYYKHFFLSLTPAIPSRFQDSLWPRQCTLGMFENNKDTLICMNTHFDFDAAVQARSAEIIMTQVSKLPSDTPAILMGDFNASPDSPCYAVFTGQNQKSEDEQKAEPPYFKDAFTEPFPATYHGFTGKSDGKHIDWILYRGGITVKNTEVIYDAIDGIFPSDHFPIRAMFD